ncbi:hypothetical protein Glove_197g63 [Diversispora epigaea]|uniref:Plasmodium RESA N-terminal domain-containing protein n=1 Tax=Diversispora epigaea TaxID=1348612 RepID=A0A397IV35_9GLOM|nr:hypothetical protein Glove_197g65 [Diversispora epigaea]RHZ76480.1 hypothetical protein Glove_197g63 [Diversispora epigaea]
MLLRQKTVEDKWNNHDNKETQQRAFNVKLFNNELPTLEKLKDRFSKIYENDSCIRCNLEKEDQQDDYRSMWGYMQKYVQNTRSIKGTSHSLRFVTHELADQIMDDVFNQFKLFLHIHIWKDRYAAVKKWETEYGISNNKWKKKVCNETFDTTVISQTNNTDNNSVLNNTTQDLYIIMLSKIAVIGLGCIK